MLSSASGPGRRTFISGKSTQARGRTSKHSTWDAVLIEIKNIKEGSSGLPLVEPVDEYLAKFNRTIVLAAAQRLRGLGHGKAVELSIQLRIARAGSLSTLLEKKHQETVYTALRRDCEVACWLLSLRSQRRTRSLAIRIGRALGDLAHRKNLERAREELRQFELVTFEMAEPKRQRRSRSPIVLPRVFQFSHAVLRDTGLELLGEEISPVFVELERRHVRLMLAAWFAGIALKREENAISNFARWLKFLRKPLERLLGTAASRTNISQLRKAVIFDGDTFLSGTPPTAVLRVKLGFAQISDPKVISRCELELLATNFQIDWTRPGG